MEAITEKKSNEEEVEEAADLLEEFWFFSNLLQRRNTDTFLMKRWFSDPCPSSSSSSSNNQEMMSFTHDSKPPQFAGAPAVMIKSTEPSRVLHRTPSLPPCLGKDEVVVEEQQRGSRSRSRSHPRFNKPNISKGTPTTDHLTRGMEKGEQNKEIPTCKEKLVKKFDTRSSASSKKLSRSPHGSRNERSDPNRNDSVVEDNEDGPSMDQIYQLMLGKSRPISSHTQDGEPSSSKSPNPMKLLGENVGNGYAGCEGTKPSPRAALLRAPSLPPCVGRAEVVQEQRGSQSHPRLSKSNRQASLNLSEILPPRRSTKGAPNYLSTDKEMKRRILNRAKSMRSRCELESEEVQGFKDLGFTFDKKDLDPKLVNILPGLQEKSNEEADNGKEEEVNKGPYLSESWLSHNFAPPIPKWTPKGGVGSPEDLKAHIKFWARAVASNVGQEC